jgi:sugar lactone lactonase YvrE/cell division septation protein DedD
MNKYAGKVRIGVIAILCAVAFAIAGLHRSSGRAYSAGPTPTFLVTDVCSSAVTAYSAASNGDVSPLAPVPTGLSAPQFVAIDAGGNTYATNACTNTITIYAQGSKGDAAPIAVIGGSNTGLSDPAGIALDSSGNIYVANAGAANVTVYPPLAGSTGPLNEAPIAIIGGNNTGLSYPQGITVDSSGNTYVADANAASVFVYGSKGNVAPTATISGSNTGLSGPEGIVLDSSRNIYVADANAASVFVYSAGSTGNVAPTANIVGSNTGLSTPYGIGLDSTGAIYVADALAATVFVFPRLAGLTSQPNYPDVTPLGAVSGSKTGLSYPQGIALDSSDNFYVADNAANSVFVYQAGSKGNIAPIPAISAAMTTGLSYPQGIALDSSGKIYVTDAGDSEASPLIPASVFVYPAGSNGNTAPTATISGSNTGLSYPQGIALDSSRNIYVVDENPSVFVYSAGSTGNVAPTTTISGDATGLDSPVGIALDSSRNIYVADEGNVSCDGTSESVYVYAAGSTGDAVPIAIIGGTDTGLCYPVGIALDSSGNIYVADEGAASVFVYPPLASLPTQANYPDVTPIATISGSNTGLISPYGIAFDSSGNIYVADDGAPDAYPTPIFPSVFVYSAGSTGNVAPTSTISGPLTELGEPQFIAIQPPPPIATPTATSTATATATATGDPTPATPTATPTATATAATSTPTPTATPALVTLEFVPKSLKFPKTRVGARSKPKTMKVSNPKGNKEHPGIAVQIDGTYSDNPGVFAVTSECKQTLEPGRSCKVSMTFTPPDATPQSGNLMIFGTAIIPSPQTAPLSGTGKAAKKK